MNALELLQEHFGFSTFRPGQREVMSALWKHQAALAVFPTGGGKSLCYQLPALMFEGVTLVVSPLIALMKDQIDFLTSHGIAAARLDSTLSADEARAVTDGMRNGTLKLLYVAPERFNNERFISAVASSKISLFAVDEAHCISEWGHNFRPDYLKLAEIARTVGAERVLALTATATPAVVEDICRGFGIPPDGVILTGFYRPNLTLLTTPTPAAARDALLLERLQSRAPGSAIVYVTLQKTAERVASNLERAGLPAQSYHAGLAPEQRAAVQDAWMASDRGIVVATIAFGMGIDKAAVRYVYHYNLPKSLESYSQEVGRAGRDEQPSVVEMFACPDDVPTLENFAYGDTPALASLRGLVDELLSGDAQFDVSLYDLSAKHDLRQLVLRTALTYLELDGVLKQGTPYYAACEFRPLKPLPSIYSEFPGEPGKLVTSLFSQAKKGKTWYSFNPDDMARSLDQDRRRIMRALEVMDERALVELRTAQVRNRYTRLPGDHDAAALTRGLADRFYRREQAEMTRLQKVLSIVTNDGCQVNALVGYFGEIRAEPCGHCTYCQTGRSQVFADPAPQPALPGPVDVAALRAIQAANPIALQDPRQTARFLCGLSSPALTRSKLAKHPLYGVLEDYRFAEVMAWATGLG